MDLLIMPSNMRTGPSDNVDLQRRASLKQLAVLAALSVSPSIALASAETEYFDDDIYKALLKVSGWITGFHRDVNHYPLTHDLSYLQLMRDITQLLIISDESNRQTLPRLIRAFNNAGREIDDHLFNAEKDIFKALLKAWYLSQVELPPQALTNPDVQRICGNLKGHTNPEPLLNKEGKLIGQISYDEALTWQACTFTKPSATCGGPFGYWQNPPAGLNQQTS